MFFKEAHDRRTCFDVEYLLVLAIVAHVPDARTASESHYVPMRLSSRNTKQTKVQFKIVDSKKDLRP